MCAVAAPKMGFPVLGETPWCSPCPCAPRCWTSHRQRPPWQLSRPSARGLSLAGERLSAPRLPKGGRLKSLKGEESGSIYCPPGHFARIQMPLDAFLRKSSFYKINRLSCGCACACGRSSGEAGGVPGALQTLPWMVWVPKPMEKNRKGFSRSNTLWHELFPLLSAPVTPTFSGCCPSVRQLLPRYGYGPQHSCAQFLPEHLKITLTITHSLCSSPPRPRQK